MKKTVCKIGKKVMTGLLCATIAAAGISVPEGIGFGTYIALADKEKDSLSAAERLGEELAYIDEMNEDKYTADSWKQLIRTYQDAQTVYLNNSGDDAACKDAFDSLQKAKAELIFVEMDDSDARPLPMRELSGEEIVYEMGTGWNLGNTMDGHTGFTPNETIWQDVVTTKATIEAVHDMGFNTIRIPITWGTMIDDENGYGINEKWMNRVQEIVDYAISLDMYVIINIHHDGAEQSGWLRVAAEDIDPVYEKFEGVWRNIALQFRDYDEHLIFESMNEITGGDDSKEGIIRDTKVIMNLNQIFVNVVRSTGSNNESRWLSVPGRYTNIDKTVSDQYGFDIPSDTTPANRLFVAVHYYDYYFGMVENMNQTSFSSGNAISLEGEFNRLQERFTSKGIPVILGEYGCINKQNDAERAYHVEVVNLLCKQMGIVPVYWDQGWYDASMEPDYSFALVDRNTGESIYPDITSAIMRGMYQNGDDLTDVVKNPEIIPIEEISFDEKTAENDRIVLKYGDSIRIDYTVLPKDTNDVLLWRSENDAIATVSRGIIRARGIGQTTITAYSQSGSTLKELVVCVSQGDYQVKCTGIETEEDVYTLTEGETLELNAKALPENTDCQLVYSSADESIAFVNSFGKVTAVSEGSTYIILTASNGVTKYVRIQVEKKPVRNELNLALNVYYNDSDLSFWQNEYGEAITITEEGQYSLTFDCATDLSAVALDAGVTQLKNLTAIYIKDHDVTLGEESTSKVTSCDIMYDSVVINDEIELTINQTEPKSAIKASGILDTNDPINSWDGSSVEEVNAVNHVANFIGIENPTKVTVTFTISNLVFGEEESGGESGEGENPGESDEQETVWTLSAVTPESFSMVLGETTLITVSAKTDSEDALAGTKLTFVSSDEAIAYVSTLSTEVDDKGRVSCEVYASCAGTTTIKALAPDGTVTSFTVKVTEEKVEEETGKASETTAATENETEEQQMEKTRNIIEVIMLSVLLGCIALFVIGGIVIAISSGKKR